MISNRKKLSLLVMFILALGTIVLALPASAEDKAQAVTVSSSPGAAIADNSTVTDTINVSSSAPITNLQVSVNINHSHAGDLRITLRNSAGTSIRLLRGLNLTEYIYGCGSNGLSVVFDIRAGSLLDNYDCSADFEARVSGVFRPSDSLSAFYGQSTAGAWTLEVSDTVPSNDGTLANWALTFNAADDAPPPSVPILGGRAAPQCSDLDGSSSTSVRAVFPNGEDDIFCRIIAENTRYVLGPEEIGNKGVIDNGVIHAVDVYTLTGVGNPLGGQVCLEGRGGILFMSANNSPRIPTWIDARSNSGYTCATIPSSGIVVLTEIDRNGNVVGALPAADDVSSDNEITAEVEDTDSEEVTTPEGDGVATFMDTDMGGTELENCTVTTRDILNLRTAPTTNSDVITLVPFDLDLRGMARDGEWIRVVFEDGQGWLSVGFLNTSGGCDIE
jgi:subtilisin-like proprotein convertase family protein